MDPRYRPVKSIVMKRKHLNLTREDKYGHWWFEIGDPLDTGSESYGWWPGRPVGLTATMFGIPGDLNGQVTPR
jgi:hypothetical protein